MLRQILQNCSSHYKIAVFIIIITTTTVASPSPQQQQQQHHNTNSIIITTGFTVEQNQYFIIVAKDTFISTFQIPNYLQTINKQQFDLFCRSNPKLLLETCDISIHSSDVHGSTNPECDQTILIHFSAILFKKDSSTML